jgi:hypothetical protein
MAEGYTVTKRGPKGEPLEIHCEAHPHCAWTLQSSGPKRDDDPIFKAQFQEHVRIAGTPDVRALGHLRRARR